MQSRAHDRGVKLGPVLVVDDDADTRANLRDMLEDLGQDVVEANDGQEAFEFLLSNSPHHVQLILLDLDMPRMTGWELLKLLKTYVRFTSIPVLVVSRHVAHLKPGDRSAIEGCIEAPAELPKLRAMVEALVAH